MATFSRWLFMAASLILIATALSLIVFGAYGVVTSGERIDHAMLDAIGYVVIAVAVFDVAKYLIDEEVIRSRQMRQAGETRQSLTRFIATIIIATLLEAIVIIFKSARESIPDIVYPTLLIFAAVALLVGLGVFQWLSSKVERSVDEQPETAGSGDPRTPDASRQ